MIEIPKLRRIAFLSAIAVVSLFLLVALLAAYPLIIINWLPSEVWLAARIDKTAADTVHRLHSLSLGYIAWGMLLGVVLQFHRPLQKVAPLLVSLAVPLALAASEGLAGSYTVGGTAPFLIVIGLVILLHPAAKSFLRLPRYNSPMLALALAAAIPGAVYALHTGQSARDLEPGFEVGHLTFTSALALLTVIWGLIGASRHTGWEFAAAASTFGVASIAIQSIIFPEVVSGLTFLAAIATLAWCIAYGIAAFLRSSAADRNLAT